ncbi:lysozyme [Mycobacterium sp. MAA66]
MLPLQATTRCRYGGREFKRDNIFIEGSGAQPMTLYGPDTSNNNFSSVSAAIAFVSQLPGQGFSWIEQKVSEGNYYQDPYWPVISQWCRRNSFPCIGYHYVTTDEPATQAQTWLANHGGSYAMLDFEANSGDIHNFWAVVDAFNNAGVHISLSYIPHWYWQQIGSPDLSQVPGLIASNYVSGTGYASNLYPGNDNPNYWFGYGGATPQLLQFTDAAQIGTLTVDCNAFAGTLDQLIALLQGGSMTGPDPTTATLNQILAIVQDIQAQLRGPNLNGWPQLGQNSHGQNLTLVDAVAELTTEVNDIKSWIQG